MQGRPINEDSISNPIDRLLRSRGLLMSDLSYKIKQIMKIDNTFKSDSLLYIAFIAVGMTALANTFTERLVSIGASVLILVLRSFLKKYLK